MSLNLSKTELALALSYLLIIGIKRQLLSSNPQIMSALVDKHQPEPSTEMSDPPEVSTETYAYLSLMFLQSLIKCFASVLALKKLALRRPPQERQAQTPRFTHS